jgi:GTPase SAR1 family protein
LEWLIEGLLRTGSYSLIGGSTGVGKTTLMLQFLFNWTNNQPLLDYPVAKIVPFVFISLDKNPDNMNRSFLKSGLDSNTFEWHSLFKQPEVVLDDIISLTPDDCRLVVIETGTFLAENPNDKKSVRRFLSPFTGWLADTNRSCWMTGHERKGLNPLETDPRHRFEGSNYWTGGDCCSLISIWSESPIHQPNTRKISVQPRDGAIRIMDAEFNDRGQLTFNLIPASYRMFFELLPRSFSTRIAYELTGVDQRTVRRWLGDLENCQAISRTGHGTWIKES